MEVAMMVPGSRCVTPYSADCVITAVEGDWVYFRYPADRFSGAPNLAMRARWGCDMWVANGVKAGEVTNVTPPDAVGIAVVAECTGPYGTGECTPGEYDGIFPE